MLGGKGRCYKCGELVDALNGVLNTIGVHCRNRARCRLNQTEGPEDAMAKHTIKQGRDGKWALIEVPEDWKEGDLLPSPNTKDRYFGTEAEAMTALLRKLPQPPRDAN